MGVISCHSREASLIPNYVRAKSTTKCYCSNLGKQTGTQEVHPRDERNPPHTALQRKQDDVICTFGDLQQHQKLGNGQGKQIIPLTFRCTPDMPTVSSVFCLFAFAGLIFSEQLLSAMSGIESTRG